MRSKIIWLSLISLSFSFGEFLIITNPYQGENPKISQLGPYKLLTLKLYRRYNSFIQELLSILYALSYFSQIRIEIINWLGRTVKGFRGGIRKGGKVCIKRPF